MRTLASHLVTSFESSKISTTSPQTPNPVHQLTFDKINYNNSYYPAGLAVERESQACASSHNTYKEVFRGKCR